MATPSGDKPSSFLHVLVHALTTFEGSDERVPTDLVQLDTDAAAIALRPDGKLVILLLHDSQRMRFEQLDDRLHHVLRTERRDVIAGLMPGHVDVVLVHAPAQVIRYPTVPRRSQRLERTIEWHAITPDGKVVGPTPQLGHVLTYAVRETQRLLPAAFKVDLAHIERRGEDRVGEVGKQRLWNRFAASLLKRAPATLSLGAILIGLFVLQLVWGATESLTVLDRMGSMVPAKAAHGEPWRMLTAGYLHGGGGHLLGNLQALVACYFAELVLYRYRFIVLFTLAVVGGNVLALVFSDPDVPHVGASGGIFGIAAAFFWITIKDRRLLPRGAAWKLSLGFGLVLGFNILGSFGPGVSLTGHLGGLIAGTVLVLSGALTWGLPRKWMYESEPPHVARVYKIAALVCMGLSAASFAIAWGTGRPWLGSRPIASGAGTTGSHRVAFGDTPISLELPDELGAPRVEGTEGVAGKVGDPVIVGLKLSDLAAPVVDLAAKTEKLRERIEREPSDPTIERAGPPRVVTLAGRPAVVVHQRHVSDDGARIDGTRWLVLFGASLVDLEVLLPPGSDGWRDEPARIAESIRYDAARAHAPPPPTWQVTATVTAATGLTTIAAGSRCDVAMTRHGDRRCRWRVVCGGEVVYGDFQFGWNDCAAEAGGVRADDFWTSSADGDPAFEVDGEHGTLRVHDDAPEFAIEATFAPRSR